MARKIRRVKNDFSYRNLTVLSKTAIERNWLSLPVEMKCEILNHMSVSDLANLTLSSKSAMDMVLTYLFTPSGLEQMSREVQSTMALPHSHIFPVFRKKVVEIGRLLKNVTLHQCTKERLSVVKTFFEKLKMPISTLFLSAGHDPEWLHEFVGFFIQGFVKGWNKEEILLAHKYLIQTANIEKHMTEVLNSPSGSKCALENSLRRFFRSIYIDFVKESKRGYWLSLLLGNLPYVHQARLLFIIFGPVKLTSCVDWDAAVELSNSFIYYDLNLFAAGIMYLSQDGVYTEEQIQTIITEVTRLPDYWHPLYIAHFLIACGERILMNHMGCLLNNGHYLELSHFTLQCAATTLNIGKSIDSILSALTGMLTGPDQTAVDVKTFTREFPQCLDDIRLHGTRGEFLGISHFNLQRTVLCVNEAIAKSLAEISEYTVTGNHRK